MQGLNDVTALYKALKTEWSASKPNLSKCGDLLNELKVCFGSSRLGICLIFYKINYKHTIVTQRTCGEIIISVGIVPKHRISHISLLW